MKFNTHYDAVDQHSFLSPSKNAWTNYDLEKFTESYRKHLSAINGTRLHAIAKSLIDAGIKLPKSSVTMNAFVNDAIGFGMTTEQVLYFSPNSFGTADAISFKERTLRIHDLKTGISPVSMRQLEVYSALFCLEYEEDPEKIEIILRLYHMNEIIEYTPNPKVVRQLMEKIKFFDQKINELKSIEE